MRGWVIGIVVGVIVGIVLGVVAGTTVIAPRLAGQPGGANGDTIGKSAKATDGTPKDPGAPAAIAEPPVRWKMASAYSADLPQLGTLAKRLERSIWRVSGGDIEIKFHEPGALTPNGRVFDAVASGTIDAAFSSPEFWGDEIPALHLFSAVPFGPLPSEYLAWLNFGGGRDLLRDIYHKQGTHGLVCGLIAPEGSGWFRNRVYVLEDLKGLKMGFKGLGAKVMAKLGVETRDLAPGEILAALEKGAIDAAEYSMPAIDLKLGLHQMANHYYFPGWHQPATFFDLLINLKSWQALSPTRKAQIEAVCGDNTRFGLAEGGALQFAALKEMTAQGVQVHRWPVEILTALKAAWRDVATELADTDKDFSRVWQSLSAFREDYAIWRELANP
jgi:TRAP-type mannitol/chloroaromatic compound transport system substrate-binding protein